MSCMVPGDHRHYVPQWTWTSSLAVFPHLRRNQHRISLLHPHPGRAGLYFDLMPWHLRPRHEYRRLLLHLSERLVREKERDVQKLRGLRQNNRVYSRPDATGLTPSTWFPVTHYYHAIGSDGPFQHVSEEHGIHFGVRTSEES